jgi:hypothetical protein
VSSGPSSGAAAADLRGGPASLASSALPATSPTAFFLRSATVSLGSAAAASLLGFGASLVWGLLRVSQQVQFRAGHAAAAAGCCRCLGACWARCLRRAHQYAGVEVAIRGKAWSVAARDTWATLASRGMEAVVADDATDRTLLLASCVGGWALALGLAWRVWDLPSPAAGVLFAALFATGAAGMATPLAVVQGSVSAIIVSFAELPEALARTHPLVYHRFVRLTEWHLASRRRAAVARDLP